MWFFAAAVVAGCWLRVPGDLPGLWLVPLLLIPALRHRGRRLRWPLFILAGFVYGHGMLQQALDSRLPEAVSGQTFRLSATVTGLPEHERVSRGRHAGDCRRSFRVRPDPDAALPLSGRLDLSAYGDCVDLRPGDRVTVRARLFTPRARVNKAGHDSARKALSENVAARGYVRTWLTHEARSGGVDGVRWRLSQRLRETLANHPRAARWIPALVTGDRRHLTPDDWRLLRRTGTAHLVAISGLHITLVTGLVWALFRFLPPLLWRRWSTLAAQQFAVVPALAAATVYAALAGFALPTQRALIMTLVVLLALTWRRTMPRTRLLGLALVVVLLLRPLSALSVGFWLSFGAVSLLTLVAGRGVVNLVRAQALLSLGLGAVTGWLFGGWGLAAPLANLLLIPLFSLAIVPLALTGALVDPSGWGLVAAAALLDTAMTVVATLARALPELPVPVSMNAALLAGLGVAVLLVPGSLLPRWSAPFLLLPWLWPATPEPGPGGFHLTVFEVGQGQALAVRTQNHIVLYDLGPRWPGGNAGRSLLAPWLAKQRAPVELAFASHGDSDHAGGWPGVRPDLPPGVLYSGEPDRLEGGRHCHRGQSWQLDGVTIRVLWPAPGIDIRKSNNRSCVVRIRGRHGTALLTGDIEKPVEYWLAERGGLDSDIVQVPHHGSGSSSSYTFLRAVDADQGFVSAGYGNAFGHPAESVLRRYDATGVELYNSARTGMIVFRRDEQHNTAPVLWRALARRPWRAPPPGPHGQGPGMVE
jgi:competence protein ComEC